MSNTENSGISRALVRLESFRSLCTDDLHAKNHSYMPFEDRTVPIFDLDALVADLNVDNDNKLHSNSHFQNTEEKQTNYVACWCVVKFQPSTQSKEISQNFGECNFSNNFFVENQCAAVEMPDGDVFVLREPSAWNEPVSLPKDCTPETARILLLAVESRVTPTRPFSRLRAALHANALFGGVVVV